MNDTTSPANKRRSDGHSTLIARLVNLTTQISYKPLPISTIAKLSRELSHLENALDPATTTCQTNGGSHRNHLADEPGYALLSKPVTGPAGSPAGTTISASPGSRWNWSMPGASIATTSPTTAADDSNELLLKRNSSERVKGQMAIKSERLEDGKYDLLTLTGDSHLEGLICDSSKKILKDVTSLVTELQLRHEESRHIHELNLSKNQTVTRKLAAAEKEMARLRQHCRNATVQLANLETTMHYLTVDMANIGKKLDKLIADCRTGKVVTSPAVDVEIDLLASRVERWRRDCAEIASATTSNPGTPGRQT